ncbi:hypothetical protein ACOSQ4_032185 [Xanthoceras sorbifolium]
MMIPIPTNPLFESNATSREMKFVIDVIPGTIPVSLKKEESVGILDRESKELQSKTVPLVDQMERSRNEKLGQYVSRPLTATTGRDELLATKHDILGSEYRDLVIATTDRNDWLAMKKRKSWQ